MPFNLFGKKKQSSSSSQGGSDVNSVIEKQRTTLESLEKRCTFLEKKRDALAAEARKHVAAGNKRNAMSVLRRKKTLEGQLQQLDGARHNIESQMAVLEGTATQRMVMDAFSEGTSALKSMHGNLDADAVHDQMDEFRDVMETAQEAADAISQPLFDTGMDEDDLMAELNELEGEVAEQEFINLNEPVVPSHTAEPKQDVAEEPAPDNTMDELESLRKMVFD
ncbi:hypothetical protein P9112_013741 [Eukaryota sp. TZLM1-RC]